MPDREQIARQVEQLRKASLQALDDNDFLRAVQLSQARKQLESWLNDGMVGQPPVDVSSLLLDQPPAGSIADLAPAAPPPVVDRPGSAKGTSEVAWGGDEPTTEWLATPAVSRTAEGQPLPGQPAADISLPKEMDDNQLRRLMEEVRRSATSPDPDYAKSLAVLEQVMHQARDPKLRNSAQLLHAEMQARRNRRKEELLAQAQRLQQTEPSSPRLRGVWEAVLRVDPEDQAARAGLRQLDQRERTEEWRRRIRALRAPLTADRKDIREVQTARRQAAQLIDTQEITDPELRLQLDETYRQLNELRDAILKASQGGTSAERAKDFENAIKTYLAARNAGYDVIIDDMTGEPINVHEALRRTRRAYWDDLVARAGQRYTDAERALEDGYPETAVNWLEEAIGLLNKVEEGGEETRRQIDQLLSRAKEARTRTLEARQLVNEAAAETDPQLARSKLVAAKQLCPTYPDIDQLLANVERLVVDQVARDMAIDLSMARGVLGGVASERFDQARQICRQANLRGANLSITSDDLLARRREVEELLAVIDQQEQVHHQLLLQLAPVDAALQEGDLRLARLLLEDLADFKNHPEVRHRRQRLALLQDDDAKFREAEELFLFADYRAAIQLCEALIADNSAKYKASADQLRRQAQARIWLEEADDLWEAGQFVDAQQKYQLVVGLQGDLPATDQYLLDRAQAKLNELQLQQTRQQELKRRLETAISLRKQSPPAWEAWYAALQALRHEAPVWLQPQIDGEFTAGTQEWRSAAWQTADECMRKGDWRGAYQQLEPLYRMGLISDRDERWRNVEYAFYKSEAERLLASHSLTDLAQAETMAQQAWQAAPDAQRSTAELLARDVVGQAVLKAAALEAASANPGPAGAVHRLQTKLEQYPFLLNDARIRSAMMRYLLDLGDYESAAQQAKLMAYVPEEQDQADRWQELIAAAADFGHDRKTQAVRVVVDLRERTGQRPSEAFDDLLRHAVNRMLVSLYAELDPTAPLLDRVQQLDLILQLNPNDGRARSELNRLAGGLERLARQRCDELRELRLGGSLLTSLDACVKELDELQSIRRVLAQLNPNHPSVSQLQGAEGNLVSLVEIWRLAARQLAELEQLWSRCILAQEEQDVQQAEDVLRRAQHLLDQQPVTELSVWIKRLSALRTFLASSDQELGTLRHAWRDDDFEQVIESIDRLEALIRQAEADIQDGHLTLPARRIQCLDTLRGEFAPDLATLRLWAAEKRNNLADWQKWQAGFFDVQKRFNTLAERIEADLAANPPCLSRPLTQLAELEAMAAELIRQLELQPAATLSNKAQAIAQRLSPEALREALERIRQDILAQQENIRTKLLQIQDPLEQLRQFAGRKGIVLAATRNRETLRYLIAQVKAIDSCNPDAAAYEEMLRERFGW